MLKDNDQEILGRRIYEQFDIVVFLKTQVRVTEDMDQRTIAWWDKARISGDTYRRTPQLAQ